MTTPPAPEPLAGVLAEAPDSPGGDWTLVLVRELRHAPDRVWAALTEAGQLKAWAPFEPDRDLAGTGPATLTMIDGDEREDTSAVVRRSEPPTLLEYTWGDDLLRWELARVGTGTRLTLRHRLADRDWLPKVAAGWHLCLDVAEQLLAGRPVPPVRGQDAREHGAEQLAAAYATKLADR